MSRTEIESTIQNYFSGMHYRDVEKLRQAFHPSARLFGHYEGVFAELSLEEWLNRVQARPVPAEMGEPFDMAILALDITGKVASAKVRNLYRGLRFTDHLHLAQIEDHWRIVSKTFHHD